MPDTCEATVMGIPIDPNATGAVLAIKHKPAAYSGLNPNPTSIAAVIATGAPKPAIPSKKEPNENAINKTCNLLSDVMEAIKCLMISSWPLRTVMLNKNTAVMTIQQIGNNPYKAPCKEERKASFTGIL